MPYLQNNYQPAYGLFIQALEKARFAKDKLVSAECWNWLGEVCIAQGRHGDAGRMFASARDLHAQLGNERGLSHALDGLGGLAYSEGRLEEAKELYAEAEAICVRLRDDASQANVLNGIAAALTTQGRFNQAVECYTRAHDIYSRIGNDVGQLAAWLRRSESWSSHLRRGQGVLQQGAGPPWTCRQPKRPSRRPECVG